MEKICVETEAGSDIVKYIQTLSTNGRKFRSWNELVQAIKEIQAKEPGSGKK